MSEQSLKVWAESHARGPMASSVAIAVLDLFLRAELLERQIEGHCERIAAQSAILSRVAEKSIAHDGQLETA